MNQPHSPPGAPDSHLFRITRRVAWILDDKKVDPLLGFFFPFFGDIFCGLFSLFVVGIAWRHGIHRLTLARMCLNVAIDTGLGSIPIIGDIFDYFFRANTLNLKLLERSWTSPRSHWSDGVVLVTSVTICLFALLLPILLAYQTLKFIIHS